MITFALGVLVGIIIGAVGVIVIGIVSAALSERR